ncbi:MAG: metallophosphoesterase [Syntrophaceae bacterium]|nr:metallophosphoesterase [Syntrophaceae bacterium]
MTLFLASFFLVLGLMHGYVFLRGRAAFPFGPGAAVCVALVMLCMVAAPFAGRIFERQGAEETARAVAWGGYLWLGFLFILVVALLAVDLYRGLVFLAGLASRRDLTAVIPGAKAAFLVPLALSVAASAWGVHEALDIRTERVVIETDRLPAHVERLRICQISDVHLGPIVRGERLARMLDVVRQENPDLLVSTGDLVDGPPARLPGLLEQLRDIRPALGKYAVTGNHEFYVGLEQALAFTRDAGFDVMRGEARDVGGILTLAGVDDPAGRGFSLRGRADGERELLAGLSRDRFVLLLKHRPVVEEESLGLFDLQLSGHTHRGQIFPFNHIVDLYFPRSSGLHDLGHSHLYVSRGSGTWGPPIRLLAPPEVTVIEIVNSRHATH